MEDKKKDIFSKLLRGLAYLVEVKGKIMKLHIEQLLKIRVLKG